MLGVVGFGRAGKAIVDGTNGMTSSTTVDPRRYHESVQEATAQDHGGHDRERATARRPQASAARIPAGRHHQRPVRLWWRLHRTREDHLSAQPAGLDRLWR